jgi:hypothetical protein
MSPPIWLADLTQIMTQMCQPIRLELKSETLGTRMVKRGAKVYLSHLFSKFSNSNCACKGSTSSPRRSASIESAEIGATTPMSERASSPSIGAVREVKDKILASSKSIIGKVLSPTKEKLSFKSDRVRKIQNIGIITSFEGNISVTINSNLFCIVKYHSASASVKIFS